MSRSKKAERIIPCMPVQMIDLVLFNFFENNPKYHTQGGVARLQFSKEMEGVTYKDLGMDKVKQCTEIYFSSKNLTSWQSDPESKKR